MRPIHGHFLKKCTAYALALCLSLTDFCPLPAYAAAKMPPLTPETLAQFRLPETLAAVEDISFPAETDADHPFLIVVQDAHAIAEAQTSIRKIIRYLHDHYSTALVGVEGASRELDGILFRSFPDHQTLEEVFEFYNQKGEVSGVVLSAALDQLNAEYFGAEEWNLYEADINALLDALAQTPAVRAELEALARQLEQLKAQVFQPHVFEMDDALSRYGRRQISLLEFLENLRAYHERTGSPLMMEKYPLIEAAMEQVAYYDRYDRRRMAEEIHAVRSQALQHLSLQEERADFFGHEQAYETEKISPEEFLSYLQDLARRKEIRLTLSKQLAEHLAQFEMLSNIQGHAFVSQLSAYLTALSERLYTTPAEKAFYRMSRFVELAQKLTAFELTRAEFAELEEALGTSVNAPASALQIKNLDQSMRAFAEKALRDYESFAAGSAGRFKTFVSFYEIAHQREEALLENMLRQIKKRGASHAVLVAGGFHSEGILELLRERKAAYALITPKITSVPDETRYLDTLQGKVSWQRSFENRNGKLPVYEGFARDAARRLLETRMQKQPDSRRSTLKNWRDNLLHDAASRGRLAEVSDYTRFIDELFLNRYEPETLEKLKSEWLSRVDTWIEKHIPAVPAAAATAVSWNANLILEKNSRVDWSWTQPRISAAAEEQPAQHTKTKEGPLSPAPGTPGINPAVRNFFQQLAPRVLRLGLGPGAAADSGMLEHLNASRSELRSDPAVVLPRHTLVELKENGEVKITINEEKDKLPEAHGEHALLYGEAGIRAALALQILLFQKTQKSIDEWGPFEPETEEFINRLLRMRQTLEVRFGGKENLRVRRLKVLDTDQRIWAFALESKKDGKPLILALNLAESQQRRLQKDYFNIEVPAEWNSPDKRNIHKLKDLSPKLFDHKPDFREYTQVGKAMRIGLAPYATPVTSNDNIWLHFMEVETLHVPPLDVYVHEDKTRAAAKEEGGFLPGPNRVTVISKDGPVQVMGRVHLNDKFGKPVSLTPAQVANLVTAEVEHNFFYDGKRTARARLVEYDPATHKAEDGYVFALEIDPPAQPGFYEINMFFHLAADIKGAQKVFSLEDQKFAAVLLPIEESDRLIPGAANRRHVSAREIDAQRLELETPLDEELRDKAVIAHSYTLQDAAVTGELYAASNPVRGYNRTYLYSWIRDGVQDGLRHLQAHDPEVLALAHSFFDFIWDGFENGQNFTDQRWRRLNGEVRIPSSSFNYPQTDGPSHVGRFALEFLRYLHSDRYQGTDADKSRDITRARKLLKKAVEEVTANVKNTYTYLEYGHYEKDPRGFDIWEELYGIHFANVLLDYSFLMDVYNATENKEGLRLPVETQNLILAPVADGLDSVEALEKILKKQFNLSMRSEAANMHFVSHRHVAQAYKMESEKHDARLDVQQIWALLYAKYLPFEFSDRLVLGTMNALSALYTDRFPFSETVRKKYPHVVPMGRYDLDPYDGTSMLEKPFTGSGTIAMSGAHFWYIATLWRVQFDMRFASAEIAKGSFEISSEPYREYLQRLLDVESPGTKVVQGEKIERSDPRYALIVKALENRVNQTLEFVAGDITPDRSLYEQFHKEDGRPFGTADLNWSNGTFVQAVIERDRFLNLLRQEGLKESGPEAPLALRPFESGFEMLTLTELASFFSPKRASFVWRKSVNEVISQGEPGLAGFVNTYLKLQSKGGLEESLAYHSRSAGDFFSYFTAMAEMFPAEAGFIQAAVAEKMQGWENLSQAERVQRYRELIHSIDGWLVQAAGIIFERFLAERDPSQLTAYEVLLQQPLIKTFILRYLRQREGVKPLETSVSGLYAFSLETESGPRMILIHLDAVAYPDPQNPSVRKAWGKVLRNENYDAFLKASQVQNRGYLYQIVNSKTDEKYRSYRADEISASLDVGVPDIQVLEIRRRVAQISEHLAAALKSSPAQTIGKLEPIVVQIRELVQQRPAALKEYLSEIASYSRTEAENIFSKRALPSLMAFVVMLEPELLESVRSWDDLTYRALHEVILANPDVFKEGRLHFLSPSRQHSTVVLARTLDENKSFVLAVPLVPDAVSTYGDVPKIWTTVSGLEVLQLRETSVYQIRDAIRKKKYSRRFGADIIEKGWQIGMPVSAPEIKQAFPDYPVGFQMLELNRLQLPDGVAPAHDMQIKEINAREFLEVEGTGDTAERHYRSFDDVSDEEIIEWKNQGYNTIWMMGIWAESHVSRALNQKWEEPSGRGRVASAFSVPDYILNPRFGNPDVLAEYDRLIIAQRTAIEHHGRHSIQQEEAAQAAGRYFDEVFKSTDYQEAVTASRDAFVRFTRRAAKHGVRILVDFIPNHLSADSPLIAAHPEMFIHLSHAPNEDVKDFYFPYTLPGGRTIWVAHGKDGSPWADTAQLNLESPEVWRFFLERVRTFARLTQDGGARLDSLQVLKPEEYWNIWQYQLESSSFEEFTGRLARISEEVFGRRPEETNNPFEVLHEIVRKEFPDFKTVGEVYHGQHPHWQKAGVDITYVKYTYNWLAHGKDGNWDNFKDHVLRRGEHAGLSTEYLFRSSYLLEDHDERERILHALAERLGKKVDEEVVSWSKLLATAIATVPGVGLTYEGQEEGAVNLISSADWIPPFALRGSEPVHKGLKQFYHDLHQLTVQPVFRRGTAPERIPLKGIEGGELPQILAFSRSYHDQEAIVVLNHSREPSQVTLNLTHLGLGEKKLSLAPWGTYTEVIKRSEQRITEELTPEQKMRRLIFEERVLTEEYEEAILSLIPEPLFDYLRSRGIEKDNLAWQLGARNIRPKKGSRIDYAVRIGYQGDDVLVVSLYQYIPGYAINFEREALAHIPLQLAGDDTLIIVAPGRLEKLEDEGFYTENRFQYWIENNLDEFSRKIGIQTQRIYPVIDGLHRQGLEAMGFGEAGGYFERAVPAPGNVRHELRTALEPVLQQLARSRETEPAVDETEIRHLRNAFAVRPRSESLEIVHEEAAQLQYLALFAGLAGEESTLRILKLAEALQEKHPEYAASAKFFARAVVESMFTHEKDALQTNVSARRNYAFAMTIDENTRADLIPYVLEYLKQVNALRKLFPERVTGQVEIYAASGLYNAKDAEWKAFMQEVGSSRSGKIVERVHETTTRFSLEKFLKRNSNALIYGFNGDAVSASYQEHLVRSAIEGIHPEVTFTLAALLSMGLAEETGALTAELLKQVSRPVSDVVRFSGSGLEITDAALEIMFRYQADRLIAAMA